MKRFDDTVAIVTGAGSGIGRAIALRLASEDCRVLAVDRNPDGLAEIAIVDRIVPMMADVTGADAPASIIDRCHEVFGRLDILVNIAGLGGGPLKVEDVDDADLDKWMDINLRSVFRLSRDALPSLRATRGTILNMSSAAGMVGLSQPVYAAAKAGIIALTRQMAGDYGPAGIRVNAIAPGVIATPALRQRLEEGAPSVARVLRMTPLGRPGEPHEVAAAAAFLCSTDASYISGHTLCIDGGMTSTRFLDDAAA